MSGTPESGPRAWKDCPTCKGRGVMEQIVAWNDLLGRNDTGLTPCWTCEKHFKAVDAAGASTAKGAARAQVWADAAKEARAQASASRFKGEPPEVAQRLHSLATLFEHQPGIECVTPPAAERPAPTEPTAEQVETMALVIGKALYPGIMKEAWGFGGEPWTGWVTEGERDRIRDAARAVLARRPSGVSRG